MAQNTRYDEYGNPLPDAIEDLERRAAQSSQGYNAPTNTTASTQNTPSYTPQDRDRVVQGWLSYARSQSGAPTRGTIESYLGTLGNSGWRVERDDKVIDPTGRIFDWIGDVNTPNARARSGYTTDKRYASVTGATAKKAATGKVAPVVQAPAVATPIAAPAASTALSAERQALLDQLIARSNQSLAVDRNDPAIRAAADANAANIERAQRNYLADLAESEGPLANLRGEQRLAAERAGQQAGAYEADLVLREVTARREEIAQALVQRQGMWSASEEMALRRQLAAMDDAIKRLQLRQNQSQFEDDLAYRNRALAEQGRQYDNSLGFNYDQFDWARSPLNPANMRF